MFNMGNMMKQAQMMQERLQKAVELFESSTDHTPVGHLLTQEYTAEAANFVADWRDPALLKSFCIS